MRGTGVSDVEFVVGKLAVAGCAARGTDFVASMQCTAFAQLLQDSLVWTEQSTERRFERCATTGHMSGVMDAIR